MTTMNKDQMLAHLASHDEHAWFPRTTSMATLDGAHKHLHAIGQVGDTPHEHDEAGNAVPAGEHLF
jgi:hypothetical protein